MDGKSRTKKKRIANMQPIDKYLESQKELIHDMEKVYQRKREKKL